MLVGVAGEEVGNGGNQQRFAIAPGPGGVTSFAGRRGLSMEEATVGRLPGDFLRAVLRTRAGKSDSILDAWAIHTRRR